MRAFLLVYLMSLAAHGADEFQYRGSTGAYTLKKSSERLTMNGEMGSLVLPLKKCNQKIVEDLWASVVGRYKEFPQLKSKKNPNPKLRFISFNQNRRLLVTTPLNKTAVRFYKNLPQTFIATQLESNKLCQK